jgi:alkylation response protein AidB-like acyl-CoA dehydrogenase
VLDGQKVWSSNAQWSQQGFLLARTGTAEERHRGITAFIVDMASSGVETRALREITGTSDFNEVFLSGVHVTDDMVLGEVGAGWRVAMDSLGAERSGIGAGAARLKLMIQDLVRLLGSDGPAGRATMADAGARRELGRLAAGVDALNQLVRERLARELDRRRELRDHAQCHRGARARDAP